MTRTLRGLLFLSLLAAASAILGLQIRDALLQPDGLPEPAASIPASGDAGHDPAAALPALPEYDPPPVDRFVSSLSASAGLRLYAVEASRGSYSSLPLTTASMRA